jgi:tRNA threonylcarbamoyladenosine biosynthesis protein TsaB
LRTLVIDSATAACSVALFEGSQYIAGEFRVLGRGHAEHLIPMIAALPGRGRAARVAVGLGPGSFTGVRVGLAAARGLALAWHADLVGYPTLDLVAAMARAQAGAVAVGVAMTGGHGEWFVQRFAADGTAATPLASRTPAIAAAELGGLVAGSEAQAAVALRGSGTAMPLLPDARAFAVMPERALGRDMRPLYGRDPDAALPSRPV